MKTVQLNNIRSTNKLKKHQYVTPQHAVKYGLTSLPVRFHIQHEALMETNTHKGHTHYKGEEEDSYMCANAPL